MNISSALISIFAALLLTSCQSGYQTTKQTKATTAAKPIAKTSSRLKTNADMATVQSGDTLFGISFRAGLNYRDVAAWNGIEEPYTIKLGQKIRLTPPSVPSAVAEAKKTAPMLPNEKTNLSKVATPAATPAVVPALNKDVAPISTLPWQWPTKGELISGFIVDDKTNQGINIAGKPGQRINAAADGVVVYSGAGLIGYGELLIIKHNNEWISAYAHNSKRLVAEGTRVKAGQQIAEMGQTGTVRTMLHFEIRRNGKPVDPQLYLPQ